MEYSVIKDNDSRSRFYLGRQYFYSREYDKAIRLLDEYLADATWLPEIAHARLYKAQAYWYSNRGDQARVECMEAIKLNPDFKEALNLMSEMLYEPWKSKWKFIADNARNKDILF
jgi:tetratricopeptide (TPR) repeat protein